MAVSSRACGMLRQSGVGIRPSLRSQGTARPQQRRFLQRGSCCLDATPTRTTQQQRRCLSSSGGGAASEPVPGSSSSSSSSKKPAAPAAAAPSTTRGPVTWAAAVAAGLAAAGVVAYYNIEKERRLNQQIGEVKTFGKPALGGPWSLVDMHGVPRTDKDYRGRFTLLYFGFTYCPDICPSELVKVGKIVDALDKRLGPGAVKPVFISVDPERDSLVQLRHYAQDFHPSIDYLTGTKDQVARAAKAYRVYFSKADDHEEGEDYLVDHSIVLYLNGPDNDFLDFLTQRTNVDDCVERIVKAVEVRRKEGAAKATATPA